MTQQAATAKSWPHLGDFPKARAKLQVQLKLSQEEYEIFCLGYIPKDMDDKWFVYVLGGAGQCDRRRAADRQRHDHPDGCVLKHKFIACAAVATLCVCRVARLPERIFGADGLCDPIK